MKLFVFSDAHSFYTPLKEALDKAGFDPNNEDHWLISCGDVFDRGPESEEIFHYLMSIDRKILIKGNHDTLLQECCEREYFYSHDVSNGTVRTINDIGNAGMGFTFDDCCRRTHSKLARYRELLVNYFETQNYIFVHSWIPTNKIPRTHPADKWIPLSTDEYMEDWREANDVEWDAAMWGNPFKLWQAGLNKTGKTIVFGHWHCSAGHKMLGNTEDEFNGYPIWEPCYAEGIIGIDRCTVHTGEVNVLVLEDELLV
jgi:serine/threonine protein phosphatase 1